MGDGKKTPGDAVVVTGVVSVGKTGVVAEAFAVGVLTSVGEEVVAVAVAVVLGVVVVVVVVVRLAIRGNEFLRCIPIPHCCSCCC